MWRSAFSHRQPEGEEDAQPDAGYTPTLVGEVEIGQPLPALSSVNRVTGQRYERALILVRLHTQPLGLLELELAGAELDAPTYAERIWQRFAPAILEHLVQDGQPAAVGLNAAGLIPVGTPSCLSLRQQFLRSAPFVTVVVPTHDRPDHIADCLTSLLSLDYPSYEIIVVDNAPSSEATAELVGQIAQSYSSIRYVREDRPGACWARNRGLVECRSDIVAFADDDVVADRHWLTEMVRSFDRAENVACVTGNVLPRSLETRAQAWFERRAGMSMGFTRQVFDMSCNRPQRPVYPYVPNIFGAGANMAFKSAILLDMGGFDPALNPSGPALGGEDLACFFRVIVDGYTLVYDPGAVVYHEHRRDDAALRKQMRGWGVGYGAYLTRCLVDRPRGILELAAGLPEILSFLAFGNAADGLSEVLQQHRHHMARMTECYPRSTTNSLLNLERRGYFAGPLAYLRGRWHARRVRRRFGPLELDFRPPSGDSARGAAAPEQARFGQQLDMTGREG